MSKGMQFRSTKAETVHRPAPDKTEAAAEPKGKAIDDMSKDELIHALIEKGINPPDKSNKNELKELLQEG